MHQKLQKKARITFPQKIDHFSNTKKPVINSNVDILTRFCLQSAKSSRKLSEARVSHDLKRNCTTSLMLQVYANFLKTL